MFDPVAELFVGVKEVAAERRDGWSGAARSDRVLDVLRVGERLEIERIRAVAEWDAAGAWALDGAVTAVSWLVHRFPITDVEAKGLVKVASLYRRHPSIAAAADGGEIAAPHLRKMAWAERNRGDVFAISLDAILEAARQLPSLGEFHGFLNEWVNLVDERGPADVSKRMLRSRNTFGGMSSTEVWGPSDDAAVLRAALDLHDSPDPWDCPEGPRTKAQRDYDSLFDILRLYVAGKLDGDADPAGGIDLNLDANTAAELLANPDDQLDLDTRNPLAELLAPFRGGDDDHDHVHAGPDPWCEFTTGQKATLAFAAVMLCTGWVRRVTRDPRTGELLDMGRRRRLFTRVQRRALIYRDRGCVFPGCDRPAKFCDAHHIKPWEDGGLTDLVNGVLLCRRHHTLVHHGWALARDAATGVVTVTAPDGRVFTRQPPRGRSPGRCTFEQHPTGEPARC